jgi:hypothetical protein
MSNYNGSATEVANEINALASNLFAEDRPRVQTVPRQPSLVAIAKRVDREIKVAVDFAARTGMHGIAREDFLEHVADCLAHRLSDNVRSRLAGRS